MVKFAAVLKKFYAGARKKNGELYKKASLVGIHFGLQRFFSCQKMDIIKDPTSPKPTLFFKQNFTAKREGKAQTQTQASKPLKCGTSEIFDLNWKKRV